MAPGANQAEQGYTQHRAARQVLVPAETGGNGKQVTKGTKGATLAIPNVNFTALSKSTQIKLKERFSLNLSRFVPVPPPSLTIFVLYFIDFLRPETILK